MKTDSAFGGAFIQDFVIYNIVSGKVRAESWGTLKET